MNKRAPKKPQGIAGQIARRTLIILGKHEPIGMIEYWFPNLLLACYPPWMTLDYEIVIEKKFHNLMSPINRLKEEFVERRMEKRREYQRRGSRL